MSNEAALNNNINNVISFVFWKINQKIKLPFEIIAIRSPKTSASSMWCVLITIVRSFLYLNNKSQMLLRPLGSTPALGSSSMTVLEPPTKAMATDNLRCMPPERFLAKSFFLGLNIVSSRSFSHSAFVDLRSSPFKRA